MDLSVCIVNWNTRELLKACLASLEAACKDLSVQVIVVDNASSDGSPEMVRDQFPGVELIANSENRYYAAANNQAIQAAKAPLKLLLNSDIEAPPGSLATLVSWMGEHPQAGAVAPRLVYPDGRLQRSCRSFPGPAAVVFEVMLLSRLFPRSRLLGSYRMTWWDYAEDRPVDQPMASAFLVRAEALEQVGLFDEAFPMFFNDVDLCRRLRDGGWEVWFTPATTLVHHHGGSTRLVRRKMIAESGRSFLRYYRKHYRGKIPWPTYYLTVLLLLLAYANRIARVELQAALLGRTRPPEV
jgi:GT2 family glycosyltransferase